MEHKRTKNPERDGRTPRMSPGFWPSGQICRPTGKPADNKLSQTANQHNNGKSDAQNGAQKVVDVKCDRFIGGWFGFLGGSDVYFCCGIILSIHLSVPFVDIAVSRDHSLMPKVGPEPSEARVTNR